MSSCHYAFHYPLPQPPFVIHIAKPKTQRHRHPHTARNRNRLEWANPGRLCARLASIHFCLSVNNMASCVCDVVLTTAASSPLPPPAVAMSLYGACGLHCAALAHFNSHPECRRPPERCSSHQGRRGDGGGNGWRIQPSPQCAVWAK